MRTYIDFSLPTVQYLLLMGQYLQGTQNSIKTWNIHGLAVKAAFQLGLHSSDASKSFSPLEREVRKRTWYGCVMLDRSVSLDFLQYLVSLLKDSEHDFWTSKCYSKPLPQVGESNALPSSGIRCYRLSRAIKCRLF